MTKIKALIEVMRKAQFSSPEIIVSHNLSGLYQGIAGLLFAKAPLAKFPAIFSIRTDSLQYKTKEGVFPVFGVGQARRRITISS
jgi:hypothetical protein